MAVPALATRERSSGESEPWQKPRMCTDGSSQILAKAMPGCAANPPTILRKTGSTCCSDVTVTARESRDSAANDVDGGVDIYKPPADWKTGLYTSVVR